MDENGQFWKLLPDKTYETKGGKLSGFKKSKERVTILVYCNSTGNHKLPMTLIGKYVRPTCFKYVNMSALPVHYMAQKNAWVDMKIFERWFKQMFVPEVQNFMNQNGLPPKGVLLLDNCPAHLQHLESDDHQIECFFPLQILLLNFNQWTMVLLMLLRVVIAKN